MAELHFALNHMAAPELPLDAFFRLAENLGVRSVEIRNDIAGNAILDGTPAAAIRTLAEKSGLTIISINALQRFNEWNQAREQEARELATFARDCGAKALVLVPVNDRNSETDPGQALAGLNPILEEAGIIGLVEPLGFESCSLRSKQKARDAIIAGGVSGRFRLVHDTFHHHLAGEPALFADLTGLVHISGVNDAGVTVTDMRDPHRVLVEEGDRLDNIGQIRALLAAGYAGPFSFEPFAAYTTAENGHTDALHRSIDFIRSRV